VQKPDNYSRNPRVFAQDFAAKLPTAPQLTVCAFNLQLWSKPRSPLPKRQASSVKRQTSKPSTNYAAGLSRSVVRHSALERSVLRGSIRSLSAGRHGSLRHGRPRRAHLVTIPLLAAPAKPSGVDHAIVITATSGILLHASAFLNNCSSGAAGGDRTHDPWLRRPILYPLSYSRTCSTDCSG
jgi:hypothetical protein